MSGSPEELLAPSAARRASHQVSPSEGLAPLPASRDAVRHLFAFCRPQPGIERLVSKERYGETIL
ncbi:MAG: hypothetical protein Q9210_003146 [Variospora velana]